MAKKYALVSKLQSSDIKSIRKKLNLTQKEFAYLANVSVKTVENWESGKGTISGPVVTLIKILNEDPNLARNLEVEEKKMPLRLWYYYQNEICTVIDVDERKKQLQVVNYTSDDMKRAFGKAKEISYEMYEEFLESRCFPRGRDKIKITLEELDIPFYDPLMIIEKTEGRMEEDQFWIKIEK